jgi:death-on-curing protein
VLEFVQNDLYYPTFIDKLTYLVFGLCTGHYFEDSNKRVSLTIGVWFLVNNGYYWHAYSFMQCMEAIIYHVAAGRINKALLQRIITCFMNNEDYPEDLKLDIIHAISDKPTGFD